MNCRIFILIAASFIVVNGSKRSQNFCGSAARGTGLIVGGKIAEPQKWPWLAALYYVPEDKFFCAGTLISERHVLTAAHCVQPKRQEQPFSPRVIEVYLGRYDLSLQQERGTQMARLREIRMHPDYSPTVTNFDADLALIFLRHRVQFTESFSPICLTNIISNNTEGFVSGWGQSILERVGTTSSKPKEVFMTIVPNAQCFLDEYQLTFISSNRTFCGKAEGSQGPCMGDSGGGFFVSNGHKWYLRGIISSALITNGTCDVTKHSVFTDIHKFIDWIAKETSIPLVRDLALKNLKIISRAEWNAAPPGPDLLKLEPPSKRVMISHTVTPQCNSRDECIEMMLALQANARRNPPDFNDIYCNFFIGGDGLIFEGRGWTVRGEHTVGPTGSHNDALCVSFIGNFQIRQPNQASLDSFLALMDHSLSISMLDSNYIINAQRDFHASESPGIAFYNIIKTWNRFSNSSY